MLITKEPRFKLIYEALKPYIEEFGIRRIAVFGSYARGDDRPGSDIDIMVDISKHFGIYKFISLKQTVEEVLGKSIDLVERQCLEPIVKDSILSEAITIYEQKYPIFQP